MIHEKTKKSHMSKIKRINIETLKKSPKVTERINAKAFELLEKHPEGLHWSELRLKIEASDPNLHPKTVNGCIWKLVQRFPDKIYKPSRGIFRLQKYKSENEIK